MEKKDLLFYESYHRDPVNKLIHFFCIPVIIYCILVLSSYFHIRIYNFETKKTKIDIGINELIILFYNFYYLTYGIEIGTIMFLHNCLVYVISKTIFMLFPTKPKKTFFIFLAAFLIQFVGHIIEGSRPALFTGLKQTLLQAPLFNLNYIYPDLLKY